MTVIKLKALISTSELMEKQNSRQTHEDQETDLIDKVVGETGS